MSILRVIDLKNRFKKYEIDVICYLVFVTLGPFLKVIQFIICVSFNGLILITNIFKLL